MSLCWLAARQRQWHRVSYKFIRINNHYPLLVHHPDHTGEAQLDVPSKELALARRGLLNNYHTYRREKLVLEPAKGGAHLTRCSPPTPTVGLCVPKTCSLESPFVTLRFWSSTTAPHLAPPVCLRSGDRT